jgi:transcriptional regulator with XRE-family HTH domain
MPRPQPTQESLRVGAFLVALRKARGLKVRETAALLGVDVSSLRDWEAGRVHAIRLMYRERLAGVYEREPGDFLMVPVPVPEPDELAERLGRIEQRLGRIEQRLTVIEAALELSGEPGEVAADVVARLTKAAESPPPPAHAAPKTRPAGRRRNPA